MRALKLMTSALTASVLATTMAVAGWEAAPARATVESVAVIVIDNFGELPKLPDKLSPLSNCMYAPEDTNVVGDDGAGDGLPPGVSHGEAVQTRLSADLDAIPGLSGRPSANDLTYYGLEGIEGIRGPARRWAYGTQEVVLIGMDTDGYTTLELAARIAVVKEALRLSTSGITRVVFNMSFVIVPCNVPAWLASLDLFDVERTLGAYRALLGVHPELDDLNQELNDFPTDPAERRRRLLEPDPSDPLMPLRILAAPAEFYGLADPASYHLPHDMWQRLNSDPLRFRLGNLASTSPVVPVAAAGNGLRVYNHLHNKLVRVRFSFPFAPALWDPVLAVSGGVDPVTLAGYSNDGEVLMTGTTYVPGPDGQVEVHGSSFAAPRLAASIATYLLTGGPTPCEGHLPVLGYTNSGLSGQLWRNKPLPDAAAAFCGVYPYHTTLV